jgi:hypothetical protein
MAERALDHAISLPALAVVFDPDRYTTTDSLRDIWRPGGLIDQHAKPDP